MKLPGINCQLYHEGKCSHASARRIFLGSKDCILIAFQDPRIGSCRVQIPHAKLNPPPRAP